MSNNDIYLQRQIEAKNAGLAKNKNIEWSDRSYNLTIGEKPQFIWYRNAKVGTRTLLKFFNDNVDLSVHQVFGWQYPLEPYQNYFKFAFVRNPWDRLVSAWKNKIIHKNTKEFDEETHAKMCNFDAFVDYLNQGGQIRYDNDAHFKLQSDLIDFNQVDFIGRFEHFERDFLKVMSILGITVEEIPWKNKNKDQTPYHEFYTDHSRGIVSELYRKDIQLFGYDFHNSPT
jgi:hypothetical protein